MKDNKETLDAENPKPLNPRTKEARSIIPQKNVNSKELNQQFVNIPYYFNTVIGSNFTSNQLRRISKWGPVALPLFPNVPTTSPCLIFDLPLHRYLSCACKVCLSRDHDQNNCTPCKIHVFFWECHNSIHHSFYWCPFRRVKIYPIMRSSWFTI